MEEILHQLRLVVYPIIYKVSDIPGGARFLPSTVVTATPSFKSCDALMIAKPGAGHGSVSFADFCDASGGTR